MPVCLPPWWILNNVEPAGPEKNHGTWTSITFSKEQQAQFGVDEEGEILDQAKFDAAIEALGGGGGCVDPPMDRLGPFRIALPDGKGDLIPSKDNDKLVLGSPGPACWQIASEDAVDDWLELRHENDMRLDLTNPGQKPCMDTAADVSGQHWKLVEAGDGFKLSSMWAGEDKFLTATGGIGSTVDLKSGSSKAGQIWEVVDDSGTRWQAEPEVAICDFGEIVGGDGGYSAGPVMEAEIDGGDVMICGGLAPPEEGGPDELLAQIRAEAERRHGKAFKQFDCVHTRTQVVAGTNHHCKVAIDADKFVHVTIFEPLPGQGPPQLTNFEAGKTIDDEL